MDHPEFRDKKIFDFHFSFNPVLDSRLKAGLKEKKHGPPFKEAVKKFFYAMTVRNFQKIPRTSPVD